MEHVFKLPFCIISRSFRPSPRNPLPPGWRRDLYHPVMASYGSVYLLRKDYFRRLCAGAVFQLDVFVVNCMHLCVAFLMAPVRAHSQQFEHFQLIFSRDYLRTCPSMAVQGCRHVCRVPVWPITGHMLPASGGARLVAPSRRLLASGFINFLLHYSFPFNRLEPSVAFLLQT